MKTFKKLVFARSRGDVNTLSTHKCTQRSFSRSLWEVQNTGLNECGSLLNISSGKIMIAEHAVRS